MAAPPSNPNILSALFFALVLSLSVEAREMSYFAKFSPSSKPENDPEKEKPSYRNDAYNPYKEAEKENNNPFGNKFDQQFKQFDQSEDENRLPNTYTPFNQNPQYDRYSSKPSKTGTNYYNSNPFEEEDEHPTVKRGSGTIPKRTSQVDDEPMGMSDTRKMYNGVFQYKPNEESKHGSPYESSTVRNNWYGQQYQSDREGVSYDPERRPTYDP